jgi:hypothetical protein
MVRPPSLELGTPGLGNREHGTISLRILRNTPDLYENFMNWRLASLSRSCGVTGRGSTPGSAELWEILGYPAQRPLQGGKRISESSNHESTGVVEK